MARPLPRCAHCGGSLARKGRIVVTWTWFRGQPRAGWHSEDTPPCWELDGLPRPILVGGPEGLARIAEIEARGPGRVARYAQRTAPRRAVAVAR